jgi:diguanylate cyclase (GGDEF)-like protein/PAS domain S-box-containing protein
VSTDAQHDLYRLALDALSQAVVVTDPAGTVLCWNPAAEALYGYSATEAVGRALHELIVPPEGWAAARAERDRVARGTTYTGDWQVRDKSGRVFTVHIASSAVTGPDGRRVATVGVSYDVSARRAAEARARSQADIVEHSLDVIVETDPAGVIRTANPAVVEMFGYEPAELLGRHIELLIPEDRRAEMAAIVAAVVAGGPSGTIATTRLHRDGSVLDTSLRLSPIRDEDGTVTAVSGIARDVTDEVRTRRALETSERRFRARFEQTNLAQVVVGLDGRIVSANPAACALVGRDALVGMTLRELRHPLDAGANDERLPAILAGRAESGSWERLIAHADGTAVPILVNAALLREADGTPYAVAGFLQDLTALRKAESALSGREALFAALVRQATDLSAVISAEGVLTYVSRSAQTVFGYDPDALAGADVWSFLHPDDMAEARAAFAAVVADPGRVETVCVRARDAEGRWLWVEQSFANHLSDQHIAGVVCNGRDVTGRVEAESALRASEARYRAIAETSQEGILACDATGRTLYANQKTAGILGVPIETVYERAVPRLIAPGDMAFVADKLRHRQERGPEEYDLTYPHPDGRPRVLRLSVSPLRDDRGPVGSLAMITDVTAERSAVEELRSRALNDELTGIANRTLFQDRLEHALVRAVRRGTGSVAVIFADLDQFKLVNDTWGHAMGDTLLVQVAARLAAAAPDGDTVARFGGDQFAILSEDADEVAARVLAESLVEALAEPFDMGGERVYVSACFGIAVSPPNSARDLMRFADAALYDAKVHGRARIQTFDVALAHDAADRLGLGNDLRDAIANDELALHYQPIVDLATGRLQGLEALARWTHPRRGVVPPAQFAAIAEATGMAPLLDRWAVERACLDHAVLRAAAGLHIRVAVNVSATHLADPGFERMILSALRRNDIPHGGLSLEITESAIMDQPDTARLLLERLLERGVPAAIDDFGTGYSSLGYLNRLPATTLKIDRGFVERICEDADSLAIAASIVDLARTLNLSTIAEGVETVEQLGMVHGLGCDAAQGFLWSPAVAPERLGEVLAALPKGLFDVRGDVHAVPRIPVRPRDKVTADHGLHELMRLHRSGASLSTIAAALNSDGFRTPRGLRWHRATVAQVISDTAFPNLWQASS